MVTIFKASCLLDCHGIIALHISVKKNKINNLKLEDRDECSNFYFFNFNTKEVFKDIFIGGLINKLTFGHKYISINLPILITVHIQRQMLKIYIYNLLKYINKYTSKL